MKSSNIPVIKDAYVTQGYAVLAPDMSLARHERETAIWTGDRRDLGLKESYKSCASEVSNATQGASWEVKHPGADPFRYGPNR